MRVDELMSRNVAVCRSSDMLVRAAELMWNHDCGFLPVVSDAEGRKLAGAITDRDIAMAAYTQGKTLAAIPVTSAMARAVTVCHPDDNVITALALMRLMQVRRLPVIDPRGHLVGVLSIEDVARGLRAKTNGRAEISAAAVTDALAAICRHRNERGFTVSLEYIE